MKLKYIFSTLAALFLLAGCEEEKHSPFDEITGFAELFATLGEAEEMQTRAATTAYGTYTAFEEGDQIGLYATGALRRYNHETDREKDVASLPRVVNIPFEMYEKSTNIKWGDPVADEAILKWDTRINTDAEEGNPDGGKAADIYAYFPYQESYNNHETNGNFQIFTNESQNQLRDILVAQRTTVENNNPAIFLTFKHRFSLLRLSLGTGMAAVTESDEIVAITTEGIAGEATIQMADYVVRLEQGNIKNFKATRSGANYYIILPAGTIGENTTDSLKVEQIKIGADTPSPLADPIVMQPGMIYHMTMHKHGGSITFEENGIEIWGGNHDLGGIREEPGIYWASDLSNLITQYNSNPTKENLSLEAYGTWDEDKGYWVFDLMRHIDMNDIVWTDIPFKSFHGIFNGNGYSITGLDIVSDNEDLDPDDRLPVSGLFNVVKSGSVISDLTLVNISINSKGSSAGALAGTVEGNVTIHNCHITGNSVVNGGDATGGLIGSSGATIIRCSSAAEVNASGDGVGGLVGESSGTLEDSYATGRVTATGDNVGGLVGSGSTITNCYAACSVTGENNVGGLAGSAGDVENCYAVGDIKGLENVGGLIGQASGYVTHSSSGGTVTGEATVGGLIGEFSGESVSYSYSRSTVSGKSGTVGGLIGWTEDAVTETITTYPEDPDGDGSEDETEDDGTNGDDGTEGNDTGENNGTDDDGDGNDDGDDDNNEDDPDPIITIEYVSGPKITYSYATNGLPLIGSGGWIEYGYDTGKVTVEPEMGSCYYSISLSSIGKEDGDDIDAILTGLNSEENTSPAWVIGIVIIEGQRYSLPILTSNK